MNESNKKTAMQAGLMIVLFLMLAGLAVRMVMSMKPQKRHKTPATATASADADKGGTPSATNMPPVPKSGEPPSSKASMELSQADLHLNPNQFKVYSLNPPKNPFVQTEDMYSSELKKIPGYPQLKNGDYLNQSEAFLPNIPLINQEEWDNIQVSREVHVDPYQIMGTNDDGTITTNIRLTPKAPPSSQLTWTPATGVPVKELLQPGVTKRYAEALSGEDKVVMAKKDEGGFVADALGVPGDGGARGTDDALAGEGQGDSLFAVGVSHHGKEATALVRHNGKTRIVREGSVLPTHYQVLTIKENGVVVVDLRDGSSNWLPLGAAPAEDAKKVAQKAKSA
jgi:hypothetical protein